MNNPEPLMTGARQTMQTWARVIPVFEDIPEKFQKACRPYLKNSFPFPHLVLAPAIHTARFPATQKLLCEMEGVIYIWEAIGANIQLTAYPLNKIRALEVGSILLNSWMLIDGQTVEGSLVSTPVPFNTATLRHFQPILQMLRPGAMDLEEPDWQAELDKFDNLAALNFKFMSFARESMVRGQKVNETIWQPAIQKHIISILGHSFNKTTTLAHLAILTTTELILISDDEEAGENRGVRYGGVWQYIPLTHIKALVIEEVAGQTLALKVEFIDGGQPRELLYSISNQSSLQHFQSQFSQLREGILN